MILKLLRRLILKNLSLDLSLDSPKTARLLSKFH